MPQLISTCVISSFIENNLHRKYLSTVPAILTDLNKFVVCLYDCINDVLLISQSVDLNSKNRGQLSRSAVLFLWLVINHSNHIVIDFLMFMFMFILYGVFRKFLKKLPNTKILQKYYNMLLSLENPMDLISDYE